MFEAAGNGNVAQGQGTLIANRYRVEHILGAGSEGAFYRAIDTERGNISVVVQRISTRAAPVGAIESSTWLLERVRQLQALKHISLKQFTAAWHEPDGDGVFYLVSDYVPGNTLDQEYREFQESMSWRRVVDIGVALAGLLGYLHAQQNRPLLGILRPQRVVIDARSDVPTLVACGLGAWLDASVGDRPAFKPFEQWIGRLVPQRDIYALGMILASLLGTLNPDTEYSGHRRAGLDVQRSMRATVAAVLARLSGQPPALLDVLRRATVFAAEDRYASAGDLEAALRSIRGPAVEVESHMLSEPEGTPVWDQVGLTREAFFALPTRQRNDLVLRAFERKSPLQS